MNKHQLDFLYTDCMVSKIPLTDTEINSRKKATRTCMPTVPKWKTEVPELALLDEHGKQRLVGKCDRRDVDVSRREHSLLCWTGRDGGSITIF